MVNDRRFVPRLLVRVSIVLILASAPLSEAYAATRTWSATPVSTSMSNPANWAGGIAPLAGDDLVFTGTSTIMTLSYDIAVVPGSYRFESTGWIITGAGNMVVGAGGIRCTAGGGATNTISVTVQSVGVPLNLDAASGCTLQFQSQLLGSDLGVSIGEFGGTGTVRFAVLNSLGGQVRVRNGLLNCASDGCLRNSNGMPAVGTIVESGAAMRVVGTVSSEHLTLNGGNGQGSGAVFTDTGVSWFGPIVITADASVGGTGNFTLSQGISGAGGLTKVGTGTMTMSLAASTYAGATLVTAGRLNINGPTSTSSTTVQSGATLGGIGTLPNGVAVNPGGTLAPGGSPGILNTGNLALSSGSTLAAELNGATPGTGHDQVNVAGSVALGGATLAVTLGFVPAPGNVFTIIANDGGDAVSGTFVGLAEGASIGLGGTTFVISYIGGTGNDVVLTTASAVPTLPSTLIILMMVLLLLAVGAWRLRRHPHSAIGGLA